MSTVYMASQIGQTDLLCFILLFFGSLLNVLLCFGVLVEFTKENESSDSFQSYIIISTELISKHRKDIDNI